MTTFLVRGYRTNRGVYPDAREDTESEGSAETVGRFYLDRWTQCERVRVYAADGETLLASVKRENAT